MNFDDTLREILETCQRNPREGLSFLAGLSPELQQNPMMMFGKLMALRNLAMESIVLQDNFSRLGAWDLEEIRQGFSSEQIDILREALDQIKQLERAHPGYIENMGDPDDRFGEMLADSVCMAIERLYPGIVQSTLGWTKLAFFGAEDRIGFVPGLRDEIPDGVIPRLINTRFALDKITRSAVALSYDDRSPASVDFYLLELLYSETDSIGEAKILGTLTLANNKSYGYRPEEAS